MMKLKKHLPTTSSKGVHMRLFRRTLSLLGLSILTACTSVSTFLSANPFPKGKAVSTATETTPPKRIMDGSRPFTLPEIEERLLKVLALPPAQISKESVEKAFGVVLEGEDNTFYENTSEAPPIAFLLEVLTPRPVGRIFEYNIFLRKTNEKGKEILIETPHEIPAAYKFAYLPFVQKLEKLGWKAEGVHRNVGYYWNYFVKDDFLMKLYIDDYLGVASEEPDYSRTGISRIVIDAPNKR